MKVIEKETEKVIEKETEKEKEKVYCLYTFNYKSRNFINKYKIVVPKS